MKAAAAATETATATHAAAETTAYRTATEAAHRDSATMETPADGPMETATNGAAAEPAADSSTVESTHRSTVKATYSPAVKPAHASAMETADASAMKSAVKSAMEAIMHVEIVMNKTSVREVTTVRIIDSAEPAGKRIEESRGVPTAIIWVTIIRITASHIHNGRCRRCGVIRTGIGKRRCLGRCFRRGCVGYHWSLCGRGCL